MRSSGEDEAIKMDFKDTVGGQDRGKSVKILTLVFPQEQSQLSISQLYWQSVKSPAISTIHFVKTEMTVCDGRH